MYARSLLFTLLIAIPLHGETGQEAVDRLMAAHVTGAALDGVCHQRDCAWSGLYWHTDLESAKTEARRTHRPILALRLLGSLEDELSCANSRFFRTILYSDPKIAAYMKSHFVLEWESVRPVPKVTIDFGDGRVMHRTITGNSIHYLLDEDGVPIDALPGLYAPAMFLSQLEEMQGWYAEYHSSAPKDRPTAIREYHFSRRISAGGVSSSAERVTAWDASTRAMTKSGAEAPMLRKVHFGVADPIAQKASNLITPVAPPDLPELDPQSVALIRMKHGDADFDAVLQRLRETLRADTMKNEDELRPRIHELFFGTAPWKLDALNDAIYEGVFLTPRSDPWMGLMPEPVFTAINGEGLESR